MTTPTTTLTNCPAWCTLTPGHKWDSESPDGRLSRGHAGPTFGAHVQPDGVEYADAPGELTVSAYVAVDDWEGLTADEMVELAVNLTRAAGWMRRAGA